MIRVVSSMATRHLLEELARGHDVELVSIGGVDAARRVAAGEAFDVAILAGEAIGALAAAGHLDGASRVLVARSGIAVAVPAGAPRPDVRDEAAVRAAVLSADRIGYSTGPSGKYLAQLFASWGIADEVAARTVVPPPGVPVATLVARGEATLGFQQLSELVHAEGIAVAGLLPEGIQEMTDFVGAVSAKARDRQGALAFLAQLAGPGTAAAKRRHGMEP